MYGTGVGGPPGAYSALPAGAAFHHRQLPPPAIMVGVGAGFGTPPPAVPAPASTVDLTATPVTPDSRPRSHVNSPSATTLLESPATSAATSTSSPVTPGGGACAAAAPAADTVVGIEEQENIPQSPPKKLRSSKPDYADWGNSDLRAEIRRRSGKASGAVRFGPEDGDVTTKLSTARRDELLYIVDKMDTWAAAKGEDPPWLYAPPYTPPSKREKRKREAQDVEVEGEKEEKANYTTPSDTARLIAICFSEDFYKEVCRSNQTSKDRNDHDLKRVGKKSQLWVRIAHAFVKKDFKIDGVLPSNPVSHAASTAEGVPEMWEKLKALDYIGPADK